MARTPIVLASGNLGKLKEIRTMLASFDFELIPQSQFQVIEAKETGLTFIENALIKARHAASKTGLPAIADDSGLEVDCLKGRPGIYSARYAGENANSSQNIQKLLDDMQSVPEAQRSARFQCVMVYLRHPLDPTPIIAQGTWEGRILSQKNGSEGFGYDPVFHVPEFQCSAAELSPETKNKISHRAQALQSLMQQFKW